MITKEVIGKELYVWIYIRGKRDLLYKRWLDKGYGMVMDRHPFTAKDTESFSSGKDKECVKQNNVIDFCSTCGCDLYSDREHNCKL